LKSAYQTPITIKEVLERVHRHDYVLPAIQREFVWEPEQICRLFDSLLRGYPIGTFLFWNVQAATASEFQFYDVVREYHELKNPHSPRVSFPQPRDVVAILDGQQRLTSLNIGLCGSYAEKLPRKRTSSLDAYPPKRLRLDLCHLGTDEDDTLFRLAFLTDDEVSRPGQDSHWFTVASVLDLPDAGPAVFSYVQRAGLASHPTAFHTLAKLQQVVHEDGLVSFYLEDNQELDKVLDIFIRVNSGGTVLSKSDLLLSVATAQFQTLDAREEVHGLVDDLNAVGHGFNFSKDLVLKSGLVLSDIADVGFKVQNFTTTNIRILEHAWQGIERSLRLAVKLLSSFGFSASTLKANSVLIPIAHYLHARDHDDRYLTHATWRDDRDALRRWTIRSLVKPGIWGSGLDGLLRVQRAAINDTTGLFPVEELEAAMAPQGKSLRIDAALLDDLVEILYRDKRLFPVLALLYPGVDTRNEFHVDHVFPKSLFTPARLEAAGVPKALVDEFRARFDRMPNLQLLEGPENEAKRNKLPADWAKGQYPDPVARGGWLAAHDLHDLPVDLEEFLTFYEARRLRMRARLAEALGVIGVDAAAIAPGVSNEPGTSPVPVRRVAGPGRPTTKAYFAESLQHLVEAGIVEVGLVLSGRHRSETFTVRITDDGRPEADGLAFDSLSQAARELTGQSAVNGWKFWKLADGRSIGELRSS
jgi:hypothetical protein